MRQNRKNMPDWMDVPITTFTWMIMPELEEFLSKNSNILTFKSLFDIDYMDEDDIKKLLLKSVRR